MPENPSSDNWRSDEQQQPLRVLVVDDHEAVRVGVITSLRHRLSNPGNPPPDIVGAATFEDAISILADPETFDIAVLDMMLGARSGMEIASFVWERQLPTRCVMLVANKTPQMVINSFETGSVAAIVEKAQGISPLVDAIQAARRGHIALSRHDVDTAKQQLAHTGSIDRSALSAREAMIADLVADGYTDADIAAQLHTSPASVRNTLSRLNRKLGLSGRNKLAVAVWRERSLNSGVGPA